MKCDCGNEFQGNFCPNCGRAAVNESAPRKQPSDNKKSILDKLEFLTDKKTMLSAGAVVTGIYAVFAGYLFSAPLFFIGAVLFSPQMRRRHSAEIRLLSILGSIMLFLGIVNVYFQEAYTQVVIDDLTGGYSTNEPTTNEDRYGNWHE